MKKEVVIIKTGIANVASLCAAFKRLGYMPTLSDDSKEIEQAEKLVLPGVGAFGEGMKVLRQKGLDSVIKERITNGYPTLAICLGLQLLCEQSEEAPGVLGLGVLPIKVKRFQDNVCVPQIGWNLIEPQDDCKLLEKAQMYFANSYCLNFENSDGNNGEVLSARWQIAYSNHGQRFISALERGAVLGCQFHAELSSKAGSELLGRWLDVK